MLLHDRSVDSKLSILQIRIHILEYVFEDTATENTVFNSRKVPGCIILNQDYSATSSLHALSTCRQLYIDGSLLALNRTSFLCTSLFCDIPARLSILHPKQIAAIRSIAFVADQRHFRKLLDWGQQPFGMAGLSLDTITIVLHRSSFWHYLFDFTADIVKLLRTLKRVRRLVFVRNAALVKGSFKTWYNRLIGLMMKTDHFQRYDVLPPTPEEVWWTWSYEERTQSFTLEAQPARDMMDEETYMTRMLPLMEELRDSMEHEEWNPDPRSRNGA